MQSLRYERARLRALEGDGEEFERLDFDAVGDDVAPQALHRLFAEVAVGRENESVVGAENMEIGEDVSLCRQKGRVSSLAGRERLDVVRDDAVEEPHAVFARKSELRAEREIKKAGGRADGQVLAHRVGKARRHYRAVIGAERRALGGVIIRERRATRFSHLTSPQVSGN